jgi:hypothetical protein
MNFWPCERFGFLAPLWHPPASLPCEINCSLPRSNLVAKLTAVDHADVAEEFWTAIIDDNKFKVEPPLQENAPVRFLDEGTPIVTGGNGIRSGGSC